MEKNRKLLIITYHKNVLIINKEHKENKDTRKGKKEA